MSGSFVQMDRLQTTWPTYSGLRNIENKLLTSHLPSARRFVRFHAAPGAGTPRALRPEQIERRPSPAARYSRARAICGQVLQALDHRR